MAGVILHPARLLDQHRDPPRGPQTRVEAQGLGPALEPLLDAPQVARAEQRLAACAPGLLQAVAARHEQLPGPPIHRLAMHCEPARHLGFREPLLEEHRRLEPPCFERIEIPPHPRWIPHAVRIAPRACLVTILYGSQ